MNRPVGGHAGRLAANGPDSDLLDESVWSQYDDWLRRLALRILRDRSCADDVVQQTWLAAIENPPRSRTATRAWLRRVAIHFALRIKRDHKRREQLLRKCSEQNAEETVAQSLERLESQRAVVRAVLGLPERYRDVIVLRYYRGWTPAQIAERTGRPIETIRSQLQRALRRLRATLGNGEHRLTAWLLPLLLPLLATSSGGRVALYSRYMGGILVSKTVVVSIAVTLTLGCALLYRLSEQSLRESASLSAPTKASDPASGRPMLRNSRVEGEGASDVSTATSGAKSRRAHVASSATTPAAETHFSDAETDGEQRHASSSLLASEFEALRTVYGELGWLGVKDSIPGLRALLVDEAGVTEFLDLLRTEADPWFLEALLFHTVNPATVEADRDGLTRVLESTSLHSGVWQLFEQELEPQKRSSLLTFFSSHPRLRGKRIDDFRHLALESPASEVRRTSTSALAALGAKGSVGTVLEKVAQWDPDVTCRAAAVGGLANGASPSAKAIFAEAFTDPSELVRTAALESEAELPEALVGSDPSQYLVREFRAATSTAYRSSLIDRLLEAAPQLLIAELERALEQAPSAAAERYYRLVVELVQGGVQSRWQLHRQARRAFVAFRYGADS